MSYAACLNVDTVCLMSTTMVHVRVEQKVKAKATKALAAMGLSVSDAVRVLLTRIAAEQALPFDVCVPHVPNAKTIAAMRELERGGLKSHSTAAGFMADLRNAED